jgi:hypothetical protein
MIFDPAKSKLPKVRIESNGMRFKVNVDGQDLRNITDIRVDFNRPHTVSIEMLAEVEIEGEMLVEKKNFAYINGKKYNVVEAQDGL